MLFKLLRSPSSTTNQSRSWRHSFIFFYFANGDTLKDSGLEIEFMLDTGASSSIRNHRTFWEICQTQHPITVKRSTTQTETYSGQVVPMIGFATKTFSYNPDGQFSFPLTVWITGMKTQNLLVMDFCQKQISDIHFDLPGIELKEPPNTVCYGSLHQNKLFPFFANPNNTNSTCNAHWSQERKILEVFYWRCPGSFFSWINFSPKSQCCRYRTIIS